jgi:hypothetical protein
LTGRVGFSNVLSADFFDLSGHPIRHINRIPVTEAQDAETLLPEEGVPVSIVPELAFSLVIVAIEFYDDPST